MENWNEKEGTSNKSGKSLMKSKESSKNESPKKKPQRPFKSKEFIETSSDPTSDSGSGSNSN